MRILAAPAARAALSVALAALAHPALAARPLPGHETALAALALLLVLAFWARAREARSELLAALGATTLVLAIGYDGLRGHVGTVSLDPGATTRLFEEQGPGGTSLGLRPLGFTLALGALAPEGRCELLAAADGARARLQVEPGRAAAFGGFRLGAPRVVASGEAARLHLLLAGGGEERRVDLVPGETARVADLEIALERYFPDFVLDAGNQPYSRSTEARNPAALLEVRRQDRAWRVFVIRAMPGIHRQEDLGWSFSLVSVEPAVSLRLRVAREPAAGLAGAGALLVAAGLALGLRRP